MKEKEITWHQNFNYHTHTYRCGHASFCADEEYVLMAQKNGIKQLGFSDHSPVPEIEFQNIEERMSLQEIDEYIASIRNLQTKYPDMIILCGLEAEYDPLKKNYLYKLREKVDYLILGQHSIILNLEKIPRNNNPTYPLIYANVVCEALETGLFDIVGHPDIFMKYLPSIKTKENQRLFLENAIKASEQICQKAKDLAIPLEINFAGLEKQKEYPSSLFWQIAKEKKPKVLYGIDAHNPKQISKISEYISAAQKRIDLDSLNWVDENYNPVNARTQNIYLQKQFKQIKKDNPNYEKNIMIQLIENTLDSLPNHITNKEIQKKLTKAIQEQINHTQKELQNKLSEIDDYWKQLDKTTIEIKKNQMLVEKQKKVAKQTAALREKLLTELMDICNHILQENVASKEEFLKAIKTYL